MGGRLQALRAEDKPHIKAADTRAITGSMDVDSALDAFERDFVWVSSGATHYTLNGPQRRAFADLALRQTGGILHIPKMRQ